MEIIFENVTLQTIIDAFYTGSVGLEEYSSENIFNEQTQIYDNYLIINDTRPDLSEILIKPCLINISSSALQILRHLKEEQKVDAVDTECLEFLVFTLILDSEDVSSINPQKVLMNQTLTEFILMWKSENKDLMETTGWKLIRS